MTKYYIDIENCGFKYVQNLLKSIGRTKDVDVEIVLSSCVGINKYSVDDIYNLVRDYDKNINSICVVKGDGSHKQCADHLIMFRLGQSVGSNKYSKYALVSNDASLKASFCMMNGMFGNTEFIFIDKLEGKDYAG